MSAPRVSTRQFIRELLRIAPENAVAWCAFFPEPPGSNPGQWSGNAYAADSVPKAGPNNAYYSIACFPPGSSRRKEDAFGACVVLLDDVTTKGKSEEVIKLLGEPSYRILTSEHSEQWGYFLDAVATEEQMLRVHARLTARGLCDKSGNSLVRYGRLPVGINNKAEYSLPFKVRCLSWRPENRFSIEQIIAALEESADSHSSNEASHSRSSEDDLIEQITSSDSLHEPLLVLAAKCAQRGESRDSIIAQLRAYMEVSNDRDERWQARFRDIPRQVDTAIKKYAPPERLEQIELKQGHEFEVLESTLAALGRHAISLKVFARGGRLWQPFMVKRPGFGGDEVDVLALAAIDEHALCYILSGLIRFTRKSSGRNGSIRTTIQDCPRKTAETILSLQSRWGRLPVLNQIINAPVYLGGGRLLTRDGYHREIASWIHAPQAVDVPPEPTRDDADAALDVVRSWLSEFPFETAADEAAAVALLMTCALRPSLPSAPGGVIDAADAGSGKSTLAKLIHLVATGKYPAVTQFTSNAEELRKNVDAQQMEGVQAIVIDNVLPHSPLSSDVLAQLLTEPSRRVRVLGASVVQEVPCTQFVLVTGNNIQVGEDLSRRVVRCRLVAKGDPTARRFNRPDLLEEARKARHTILSAIFTLIVAFEQSGEEIKAAPLVSYEKWCGWVQRPLVWLGMVDPVTSTRKLQTDDPDRVLLERVVDLWTRGHGQRWMTVGRVFESGQRDEISSIEDDADDQEQQARQELVDLLVTEVAPTRTGVEDRAGVGKWLRINLGRWTKSGYRIEQKHKAGGQTRWRVAARDPEEDPLLG